MKKIISYILLIGLFVVLCQGCIKNENAVIEPLHENKNFIALTNETEDLLNSIKQFTTKNKISNLAIQNELTKLKNNNSDEATQLFKINELLGSEITMKVKEYSTKFALRWSDLNKKYKMTDEYLQNECVEIFKSKFTEKYKNSVDSNTVVINNSAPAPPGSSGGAGAGCGWRYYLCSAAATAAAILCDGACIGATVGIGSPACIILCATIQAAALVQCADSFCN